VREAEQKRFLLENIHFLGGTHRITIYTVTRDQSVTHSKTVDPVISCSER